MTEGEVEPFPPGAAPTCDKFPCFRRNFHQNDDGTVEEVSFEQFLVVMAHFRPPSLHMTEEQRESVRKDKLRCVCL